MFTVVTKSDSAFSIFIFIFLQWSRDSVDIVKLGRSMELLQTALTTACGFVFTEGPVHSYTPLMTFQVLSKFNFNVMNLVILFLN